MIRALVILLMAVSIEVAWGQTPQSPGGPFDGSTTPASADVERSAAPAKDYKDAVPIREVVMLRSGVAYFQRRANVQGDSRVTLSFDTEDIDDLLKSMVVRDLGRGQIAAVNYDSKTATGRLLQSFAVDLSGNPSLAELLEQLRGVPVDVAAPQSMTGTIVSIRRDQSAMIPVVSSSVGAEKLSIYDTSVHPKHPLRGVRLTNTTDLFLMQGPVTVYDDGVYAGDALLENFSQGGERLISYSMDLDVEVSPEFDTTPQTVVDVQFAKGTLLVTKKQFREQTYLIKNSANPVRCLLIEHPKQTGWELVAPKQPAETTRDSFRFVRAVPAGETDKLHVETQRTVEKRIALSSSSFVITRKS